jgi:hypothetical protein
LTWHDTPSRRSEGERASPSHCTASSHWSRSSVLELTRSVSYLPFVAEDDDDDDDGMSRHDLDSSPPTK